MSPATFHCDLSAKATPLPHFWEHTVGSERAAIALRADWQEQLRRCHEELGVRYVRFHGLLCVERGTLALPPNPYLDSIFNADRTPGLLLADAITPLVPPLS